MIPPGQALGNPFAFGAPPTAPLCAQPFNKESFRFAKAGKPSGPPA